MRYLVTARVKPARLDALDRAIDEGTLGAGSIAGDDYLHNMAQAREFPDGSVKWVETCYCATPLAEERPYWEEYFDLVSVKDAHAGGISERPEGFGQRAGQICRDEGLPNRTHLLRARVEHVARLVF